MSDPDHAASHWDSAATFVPADPPRSSVIATWHPGGAAGLFANADGPQLDVVAPAGEGVRRDAVGVVEVPLWLAIDQLSALDDRSASPSARLWARATHLAMELIARGHVLPTVTASGWDAWQIDPLEPADHAALAALAAACPPEAHALAVPGGRGTAVADPSWLLRAYLDAVADTFLRTAAAPVALGSHPFAGVAPSPAEHARPWITAAYGHLTSATRLGLRVEVAEARSDDPTPVGFSVVIQLRSTQDPSLVVDAGEVDDRSEAVRARLGAGVSGELLVGLARAATVWPPLDRALDAAHPDRVDVDIDQLDHLVEVADDLEALGVEVLWPASFTADLRPRLVASAAPPPVPGLVPVVGLDSLLDFRWEVLCDGSPLSHLELDELADAKRSVVWLRGRWVRTDADIARRIREVPAGVAGPSGLAAALAGETVDADGVAIPVITEGFADTLRLRLGDLAGVREEDEPAGLAATLRPYQRRGVAWMADLCRAGLGGVLADDMGLGKTLQVIALHLVLNESRPFPAPMLVVCPTSVAGNWSREIARFAPGVPVRKLVGPSRHLADLASDEIVLVTYGVMRRCSDELSNIGWSVVVADEAQAIKNPRSRTARAIRTIGADARIALTGTPVENRLSELWALLDWTTPGLLGPLDRFRSDIATPIERNGSRVAGTRLALLTKPFMLRRRKTDPGVADDLPPRTHHDLVVPLSTEQLSMYEALVRESLFHINGSEGASRVGMVFRLLTGLKQIANHPGQYLHEDGGALEGRSGKLDATADMVAFAVEGDERVLVFSQYVEMCHLLRRRFQELGISSEVLHGGLSGDARDRLVQRFQDGDIPVLVVSLKAGGTGLNLTAATQVIHYDRWWNPAVEDQATDRAWRIGQTRPVVVHRMIAEGTIDERIAEMIERKRSLADRVVGGGGESWIADLDDEALAELVTLRSGAAHLWSGTVL